MSRPRPIAPAQLTRTPMRPLNLFGPELELGRPATTDDLTTPAHVVEVLHRFSTVGLDPCSNRTSLVRALVTVMLPDNGLAYDWRGRGLVWCNPPYSDPWPWVEKGLASADEIVYLVKQDTATKWGEHLTKRCNVLVLCHPPRLSFSLDGQGVLTANFSSAFFYRGPRPQRFAEHFGELGTPLALPGGNP